jgi:hypothetical protein
MVTTEYLETGRGSNSRINRTVQQVTSRFVGLLSPSELHWGGQSTDGESAGILWEWRNLKIETNFVYWKFCEDYRNQLHTNK